MTEVMKHNDTGGSIMKKLFQKIRFFAVVAADDIAIVASMFFRKRIEQETIRIEA